MNTYVMCKPCKAVVKYELESGTSSLQRLGHHTKKRSSSRLQLSTAQYCNIHMMSAAGFNAENLVQLGYRHV